MLLRHLSQHCILCLCTQQQHGAISTARHQLACAHVSVTLVCSVVAVRTGSTLHICQRGLLQRRSCGPLAAVQLSGHEVAIESMHGSNTLQVASELQVRGQLSCLVFTLSCYVSLCHAMECHVTTLDSIMVALT